MGDAAERVTIPADELARVMDEISRPGRVVEPLLNVARATFISGDPFAPLMDDTDRQAVERRTVELLRDDENGGR